MLYDATMRIQNYTFVAILHYFLLVMYVNTTSFLNRQQVFNEVYRIYAICNDITNTVSNHGSFPTLMIPLLLKSLTLIFGAGQKIKKDPNLFYSLFYTVL